MREFEAIPAQSQLRLEQRSATPSRLDRAVVCLLAGHLVLGIAHVAILPPWEGFDETAHYSYLQQVADVGGVPRLGTARISREIGRYAAVAPLPYSSVPPMERNGGMTYRGFFESPPETLAAARRVIHEPPPKPREYEPGPTGNWEAQHPPLYYWILTPLYTATREVSLGGHLFGLRVASYLMAWLALVVGLCACRTMRWLPSGRGGAGDSRWAVLGLVLWPVLLPAWFPGMARLGNDSLSALVMAAIWLTSVGMLTERLTMRRASGLGILLGLGCLTKAFFVPVTAGLLAFCTARQARIGGGRMARYAPLGVIVILTVAIAGWWYVGNWWEHGVPAGSQELVFLDRAGGLAEGLRRHFTLSAWLRGHAALVTTAAWSGTWSLARPAYPYLAPLGATAAVMGIGYLLALRRSCPTDLGWLPVWLAGPVAAGLSYHVLVRIALSGEGRGTGGYYLHVFAVPLGIAAGLGARAWWHRRAYRIAATVLGAYALLFGAAISWAQLLLFGGRLVKWGDSKFYQLAGSLPPFLGVPEALGRLEVLGFPRLGAVAWGLGGLLVSTGAVLAWTGAWDLAPVSPDRARSGEAETPRLGSRRRPT